MELTGRDFSKFGSQYDVLTRIGDGIGDPVEGPVREMDRPRDDSSNRSREGGGIYDCQGRVATLFRNGIVIEEAAKLKQTDGNDAGRRRSKTRCTTSIGLKTLCT